jgi:hypothetical protein
MDCPLRYAGVRSRIKALRTRAQLRQLTSRILACAHGYRIYPEETQTTVVKTQQTEAHSPGSRGRDTNPGHIEVGATRKQQNVNACD